MRKRPSSLEEKSDSSNAAGGVELATPSASNGEQVAELAYRLWLERGAPFGSPEEDWYAAERQLQSGGAAA